jgi:hypothetical protein
MACTRKPHLGFAAALLVGLAGCDPGSEIDPDSSENGVTSIQPTTALNQRESNACWLFATAAWVESISGTDKHYSPAYWDYWHWYEVFAMSSDDALDGTGSFGRAADIALKYGLTEQGWFVADDGVASDRALEAITKSLASGKLRNKATWKDPVAVRAELNKAFALSRDVVAKLDQTFGANGKTALDADTRGDAPIVFAQDIAVQFGSSDGTVVQGTLADAMGTPLTKGNPDRRAGHLAWSFVNGALDRTFLKRIQHVLNDGAPVPAYWLYATPARDNQWEFTTMPKGNLDDETSFSHVSLFVDYQVDDVPGFGTLEVGAPAPPEAKQASMADEANVVFFRTKDSYGIDPQQPHPGMDDVYVEYLTSQYTLCPHGKTKGCETARAFGGAILPPGY